MSNESLLNIKIFVSSPGDVAQERFLTEKVITRLQNVYRNVCKLEPIFWEHEPLTADKSFQEGLISPRETEIVICILWSRLGTRLPKNVTGGALLTGTEFEFVEAIEGRKQKGVPDLLVYRKTAKPFADLSDKLRRTEALGQIEALEMFFEKWFTNAEGALIAAFHPFERADDFEEHLEQHLRKLVDGRLAAAGISLEDGLGPTPTWLEGSPFRGLHHFDFEHEPIFFGRTKAIGEVIDHLKRQAEVGRAFLLILGMSGSGKSSLIRAGVLPALSRSGVIEGVGLCRRVILRPGDGLGDIFDSLAAALLSKEALPELASDGTTAVQLAQSLRENPGGAAMLVKGAISQAASVLTPAEPGARQPQARLLFVVDQLEELFTNDKISADDRIRFARLLTSLACNRLSQTWVIATLRSDFYAPLAQIPELADLKEGLGQYDLHAPSPAEIGLLVREPASAAGLRFEQNREGERLDDVLRDEASQDASLLPLLEFTLDELYNRRTERGKLTFEAYRSLGGVKGALAQRAESTFADLPLEVQQELPAIFRRLVTIGTLSDETPTALRVPLARFAASPARMQFVRAFIGSRLFVSDLAEDGAAVVRITHESLLARWQRLQRWLATDRELLSVKARVERAAARWLQEGRRADLLLTAGKPLDEAEQLRASGFELEPDVEELIAASRKKADRNRRLRQTAIASLAALTLAACGLAAIAQIQRGRAVSAQQATEQVNGQLQETNGKLDAAKQLAEAKRQEAVEALKTTNRQLALSYIDRGADEMGHGDRGRGFAVLGQAYRVTSDALDLRPSARSLLGAWDRILPRTLRHGDFVHNVVFSPDGTKAATTSEDMTARLWDVATGEPLCGPLRHGDKVWVVAFSPDGTKIVTTSDDKTARLWDVATGKPFGKPLQHDEAVHDAAFSPDGTMIATASGNMARLWDTATGKPFRQPLRQPDAVNVAVFSPNGTMIATASDDKTARLWDVATGRPLGAPLKHDGQVRDLAFSPDGTKILTVGGTEARLWDVGTGRPLGEPLKHDDGVTGAAFSPDGTKVATASDDSTARLWDAVTGKPLGEPLAHHREVTAVAFSPDGTMVATASADATARLWDAATGKPLGEPLKQDVFVASVAFSPDGTHLATASFDGTGRLWDVGRQVGELVQHDNTVVAVAFSPDGTKFATASIDNTARIWDAATGEPQGGPLKHDSSVNAVAFSPDGTKIATASEDGTARLWDTATGKLLGNPLKHDGAVFAAVFSPDGTKIATGSEDKTARLWDVATAKPLGGPLRHNDAVHAVVFSPDGTKIAAASGKLHGKEGEGRLWGVVTGKMLGQPLRHDGQVNAVAFSPDGMKIATASDDNTARIWDVATSKPLGNPLKHDGEVHAVRFSPNGSKIATASEDKTARLWDAVNGQPLGDPLRHEDVVRAVVFSPDGMTIATASYDKTARLWDVATGKPLGQPLKHDDGVTAVAFSPDGRQIATASFKTAWRWAVPRTVPDDPQWLAAYVKIVSRWSEDADHSLHPYSGADFDLQWREVLKSPAWFDYQRKHFQTSRHALHVYEANRQETIKNWFAAAFHLRWLAKMEPKNIEWQRRLAKAQENLAGPAHD
jgi:WD40 repeat protein